MVQKYMTILGYADQPHADNNPDQEPFQIGVIPPKANRERAGKISLKRIVVKLYNDDAIHRTY